MCSSDLRAFTSGLSYAKCRYSLPSKHKNVSAPVMLIVKKNTIELQQYSTFRIYCSNLQNQNNNFLSLFPKISSHFSLFGLSSPLSPYSLLYSFHFSGSCSLSSLFVKSPSLVNGGFQWGNRCKSFWYFLSMISYGFFFFGLWSRNMHLLIVFFFFA